MTDERADPLGFGIFRMAPSGDLVDYTERQRRLGSTLRSALGSKPYPPRGNPMQAIVTKYHGPANTRGARISATAAAGRVYVPFAYELSGKDCHRVAVDALRAKIGCTDLPDMIGGQLHDGRYVFVFAPAPRVG